MAFASISTDGVPSATLKQGLSLTDQTEEAPITVTQEDGNRLRMVVDKQKVVSTPVDNYTIRDGGIITAKWYDPEKEDDSTKGCIIQVPNDVDKMRVYIDCDDINATFDILYDSVYSSSLTYGSDSIAMGGASSVDTVITDLTGIAYLGLAYTNSSGVSSVTTVRFATETAFSLEP